MDSYPSQRAFSWLKKIQFNSPLLKYAPFISQHRSKYFSILTLCDPHQKNSQALMGVQGNIQAVPHIHSLWAIADHCNFQNKWYLRNKVVPWQECMSLALFNSQGQLSWIFIVAIRNNILVSKANCHPGPIPLEYIFQRNYFWFLANRMDFTIHYWKKEWHWIYPPKCNPFTSCWLVIQPSWF